MSLGKGYYGLLPRFGGLVEDDEFRFEEHSPGHLDGIDLYRISVPIECSPVRHEYPRNNLCEGGLSRSIVSDESHRLKKLGL